MMPAFFIVLPVGVGVGRVSETRHLYHRIEDQRRKHIHSIFDVWVATATPSFNGRSC